MLPILKRYKEGSASIAPDTVKRAPDHEESEQEFDSLESAAEDFYHSNKTADFKGMAEAMRAAFQILDSEPHHEGPHIGEDE